MAIYITGDTHGDFSRFRAEAFPEQEKLTKEDFVLITGDFGGVRDGSREQEAALDWLEGRPFTTLFVTGNHENFSLLSSYPRQEWRGGAVMRIRPSVLLLTRGQMFDLDGLRFFTMGGASSRHVEILDPSDLRYPLRRMWLERGKRPYWIKGRTWWPEELPNEAEYRTARATLDRQGWEADYIVTHCAPGFVQESLAGIQEAQREGSYLPNALTAFFEEVARRCRFRLWFLGHYHLNALVGEKYLILYDQIVRVGK